MKRYGRHCAVILILGILVMAIFAMLYPCLGWRVHTVISDSMYPTLQVGEMVVTQQVDPDTIHTGDIIAFHYPGCDQLVCHRVIDIERNSFLYFVTKGDANQNPDSRFIPAEGVVGKVQFHTPVLAHIASAVKSPIAFALLCV